MKGRLLLMSRMGVGYVSIPVTILSLRGGRGFWRKIGVELQPEPGESEGHRYEVALADLMSCDGDEDGDKPITAALITKTLRKERDEAAAKAKKKPAKKGRR